MFRNMSSLDDKKNIPHKTLDIDWKKLESEIDDTIKIWPFDFLIKKSQSLFNFLCKRNLPYFVFDSKTIIECKYMQKYAEFKISYYMSWFSIAIFFIALGFAYFITFLSSYIISSIFGIIIAIIFLILLILFIYPKYITYHNIILDIEKRILSENKKESKQFEENSIQNNTKKTMDEDQNRANNEKDARIGYQVAVDLLIAEEGGIWSRFNVMLLANSIIIAIIGLALTSQSTSPFFGIYLPTLGFVLCILWFVLINRSYCYRDYFVQTARELEKEYLANSVKILSCGEFFKKSGFPARYISYFVIIAFLVLYCILIYFYFICFNFSWSYVKHLISCWQNQGCGIWPDAAVFQGLQNDLGCQVV